MHLFALQLRITYALTYGVSVSGMPTLSDCRLPTDTAHTHKVKSETFKFRSQKHFHSLYPHLNSAFLSIFCSQIAELNGRKCSPQSEMCHFLRKTIKIDHKNCWRSIRLCVHFLPQISARGTRMAMWRHFLHSLRSAVIIDRNASQICAPPAINLQ